MCCPKPKSSRVAGGKFHERGFLVPQRASLGPCDTNEFDTRGGRQK